MGEGRSSKGEHMVMVWWTKTKCEGQGKDKSGGQYAIKKGRNDKKKKRFVRQKIQQKKMKKVISMVPTGIDPAPLWRQIRGSAFEPRVRPNSGFILLKGQALSYIENMTNSLSAKSTFLRYCQRYCGTALAVPCTGSHFNFAGAGALKDACEKEQEDTSHAQDQAAQVGSDSVVSFSAAPLLPSTGKESN